MKAKTMIVTALLTAGLGFGTVSTSANAATWHKGTPGFLRNTFYRTKLGPKYIKWPGIGWAKNPNLRRYEGFKTYRTQVKFYGAQYNYRLKHAQYKHSGKTYIIKGGSGAIKVVRVNSHLVYANSGNQTFKGGYSFNKLEKMYRIH
ncbi:hypothetical protein FD12_GL000146 [Lentilactobacillus rapi DSM 19907 = JCM 15042]|uniref:Uncharacterized protein n=2 Tax=Lentilactobacillus rapi TaxID=481723 RepID=A0A512PN61_9LACO|nr:hypothetical protein [Lentilactobacillus rapi]KRL16236.1 hypothetical protein FD12_GL000146 [Lentilactobacillus rapi DSM 19907 = JCM 15042]GEP72620.1 hypothetical protein LRA02_14880 [Lentilactobacillus rapi]